MRVRPSKRPVRPRRAPRSRLLAGAATATAALALALLGAAPALAGARWQLSSRAAPTQLPLEGEGFISVQAIDRGDAGVSASSTPLTITDTLPEGLTATGVRPRLERERVNGEPESWSCSKPEPRIVSCTLDTNATQLEIIDPYEDVELQINVAVKRTSGELTPAENEVTVAGGREASLQGTQVVEAKAPLPGETLTRALSVSGAPTPFGMEEGGYTLTAEGEDGKPDTQAGSHPFQLTTTLDFNQALQFLPPPKNVSFPGAPALVRNLSFNLPPGMLGNVKAIPQCKDLEFGTIEPSGANQCENDTAIGVARVTFNEPRTFTFTTSAVPVFNLVPAQGEPARFGFVAFKQPVVLDTRLRSGDGSATAGEGDYGVEVSVSDTTELAEILGSEVTLWGVPGAESHGQSRGWSCIGGGVWVGKFIPCEPSQSRSSAAFLTLPTACSGSLNTTVAGESWPFDSPIDGQLQGQVFNFAGQAAISGFEECAALPFAPSLKEVTPSSHEASTPTGLDVDVHVPQQGTLEGEQRGESDVKAATVTLPQGMLLSPSAANGLEACSEAQVGFEAPQSTVADPLSPNAPEPLRFSSQPAHCPPASQLATVTIHTPLLKNPVHGFVYLAEQNNNPFGSLFAVYIVVEEPEAGVRAKLASQVELDGATGQATATLTDTPQLPFEDVEVRLPPGPRASLSTPALCGSHAATAMFTPWTGNPSQPSAEASEFDDHLGAGRERLREPAALRAVVHSGRHRAAGRGLHRLLADDRPRRRRAGPEHRVGEHAARPRGAAVDGYALPRTAGICRQLQRGKRDRRSDRRVRPRPRSLHGQGRAGLHHRTLWRRAVRPLDRHPGGGRPVQPRRRGRALEHQHQPHHRGGDDLRGIADDARHHRLSGGRGSPVSHGHPRAAEAGQRARRPRTLRVRPDQLHAHVDRRRPRRGAGRQRGGVIPVPGGQLREPAVRAQADGQRGRPRQQTQRGELHRQGDHGRTRAGEHRKSRSAAAEGPVIEALDDPESVCGGGLRSQPGGV